jgi:hypothetical protein
MNVLFMIGLKKRISGGKQQEKGNMEAANWQHENVRLIELRREIGCWRYGKREYDHSKNNE